MLSLNEAIDQLAVADRNIIIKQYRLIIMLLMKAVCCQNIEIVLCLTALSSI